MTLLNAKWQTKKLHEVCDNITDGTHQTPTYFDEGYIFLSSRNVTSGKIDWSNIKYIDEKQHVDLHKRVAPKVGDILLAKNGTTGVAAMVDKDVVFDIYVSLALLRSKGDILPYYLLHFINSPVAKRQFNSRLKGIGVPNLHLKEIREVEIPYPKISEQQAIVEKLDFAFDAIEKAKANIEKNIENAKELFQSKLNAIFSQKGEGWEEMKLKEMGKVQTGNTPKTAEPDNYGDFIPFIKPADFKKDGSIVSKGTSLSEKGLKSGRLINENSALMVCIGATIGKTGYSLVPVSCNQQINAITPTKEFNYKFIYYGLISNDFNNKVLKEGKGAQATLPIINKSKWENLTMNVTLDLKKQEEIVSQLNLLSNQTNLLQEKYKQKLANLEELKKSILEKAFKGELI